MNSRNGLKFMRNCEHIREFHRVRVFAARAVLEPIAAVGDPPAGHPDRDGGDDGPPKRQCQVGDETNDHEGHPKDFALHGIILAVDTWR